MGASISSNTSVNSKAKCKYHETKGEETGPDSCEYLCEGPISGVQTRLLSCYDYEHLFILLDGKSYSTWGAMTQIGGMSGIANKNGLVEWVFKGSKVKNRDSLHGLIVRFNGVDGTSGKNKNALSVFDLTKDKICWVGNFSDNSRARSALAKGGCSTNLEAEKAP